MAMLIRTKLPPSGIRRVNAEDAEYVPYYFNCKDCGIQLVSDKLRARGVCAICWLIHNHESKWQDWQE